MKTVVLDRDVAELEIKPQQRLDEYRQLLADEVAVELAGADDLVSCSCPACQSDKGHEVFVKFGLSYLQCDHCQSVYVSPRPTEEQLVKFYRDSKSAEFWRSKILPDTRETRRRKLVLPRIEWLLDVVDEYRPQAALGTVVGYHSDLLVEELQRHQDQIEWIVTNPIADTEFGGRTYPGVTIAPRAFDAEPAHGPADVFLAFDILDRCADTEQLLACAAASLHTGGVMLATATLISGFDLQVLWERSDSIYPPERLNLYTVEGLSELFERHGFEILEFSTPGVFDMEIVQRAIRENPDDEWPRFIRYLAEKRGDDALSRFQEFLQEFRLSSFARIALRKTQ